MRLRSLTLQNIGIFADAKVELGRRAAVIAGKNNSGKTSLLAALAMQAKPLRPENSQHPRLLEWAFEVEIQDIEGIGARSGTVTVPLVPGSDKRTLFQAVEKGQLLVHLRHPPMGAHPASASHGVRPAPTSSLLYALSRGTLSYKQEIDYDDAHARQFLRGAPSSFFRLDADRSRRHEGLVDRVLHLDPRGDNLIQAFNQLHSVEKLSFLATVQRVLPEVTRLEAPASREGHAQIRLWFGSDHREGLSFNLAEVGYGTANVLAILFAATVDKGRRIILIDEPATYLHPRAVRELMAVLAEQPQHQYIFATHSFVGLEAFPEASFSLCVREPGQESATIANIGAGPAADGRRALREVGASLADVFGADRIIWTEGPSDADVLQLVLRDLKAPRGIAILPVIHTGDFDTRDLKPDHRGARRSLAVSIYQSLSKNSALIPPALAFVFDREKRNQTQLADLKRQIEGNDPAKRDRPRFFLYDEFMLENLFLDADLIAALLNQVAADPERPATPVKPISAAAIEDCWNAHVDPKYPAPARVEEPEGWRMRAHGARVLEATFDHFFDSTVEFIKAKHAPVLARLALELDGLAAQRLRAFGNRILEAVKDREGSE